jgi:hypothetical protein
MKRFKLSPWDALVAAVLGGFAWSGSVVAILLAVVAFLLYLLVRYQFSPILSQAINTSFSEEENEFIVEQKDDETCSIDLEVDLNYRRQANHFLVQGRYDTFHWKSLYEYRIDGQEVFCRLIEDESSDIGETRHDVRDGVVLESEIRERDKDKKWDWYKVDENIAKLKSRVEWQQVNSVDWHGFKYFLLSKNLPKPEARRYLRQELERLQAGTTRFFKEAEKYGLERVETSLDRFRFADGKPELTKDVWKKLNESYSSCGITDLEFSWGKKLAAVLEKLLATN